MPNPKLGYHLYNRPWIRFVRLLVNSTGQSFKKTGLTAKINPTRTERCLLGKTKEKTDQSHWLV